MSQSVGIDSINAFVARAYIDVGELFDARNLNHQRKDNLLTLERGITLPCEDPLTYAVNAARPIIDDLNELERQHIEAVIVATESGIDFGKSLSTQVHHFLNLPKRCRLFEIKQACFGGNAAFQVAINLVRCSGSPQARVVVIATDIPCPIHNLEYMEPAQGAGAVAVIVSKKPNLFIIDTGASGLHAFNIEDASRPGVDLEIADKDLSLMAYMDCLDATFADYCKQVDMVDFKNTFSYLVFHTPFAGMVKGAHRQLYRKNTQGSVDDIADDFEVRVTPSLEFCQRVGNLYSAAILLALYSLMANAKFSSPKRIGLYAYGSGCSSEFFSGVLSTTASQLDNAIQFKKSLDRRSKLSIDLYDVLSKKENRARVGDENKELPFHLFESIFQQQYSSKRLLFLKKISNYKRVYEWGQPHE